jgi:hypothetical protein
VYNARDEYYGGHVDIFNADYKGVSSLSEWTYHAIRECMSFSKSVATSTTSLTSGLCPTTQLDGSAYITVDPATLD